MSAFDRYAPFVKDYIYAHGWENLRAVQVAAAEAIFETDEHVLLTASTASGKTEAAFFPIITLFSEEPPVHAAERSLPDGGDSCLALARRCRAES